MLSEDNSAAGSSRRGLTVTAADPHFAKCILLPKKGSDSDYWPLIFDKWKTTFC